MRQYILASASPRRIEMMRTRGMNPIVLPSRAEEHEPLYSGMKETPMFLAFQKAKAAEARYLQMIPDKSKEENPAPLVIAADTIVYNCLLYTSKYFLQIFI